MLSDSNPQVTTWITIDDGCAFSYQVNGSGEMEFVCGDNAVEGFGLTMRSEALRELLALGAEALARMDALHAEEDRVA